MNALNLLPVRQLTARTGETVLVDGDYDGEYLAQYPWTVLRPSGYVVAYGMGGFSTYDVNERTGESLKNAMENRKNRKMVYLHHLVLPPKSGFWITHINGNRLDNRSCNLMYITPQDSALRRDINIATRSKTGYRGVVHRPENGTYVVRIGGEHIGVFYSVEAAARAYDLHAKRLYGDRAVLNFKEEQ